MIPTPGQKVWFECRGGKQLADGVYAAIAITPWMTDRGWWAIEIEGDPWPRFAHQDFLRPRDDPPPQREPKREQIGSWDGCGWQPAREIA